MIGFHPEEHQKSWNEDTVLRHENALHPGDLQCTRHTKNKVCVSRPEYFPISLWCRAWNRKMQNPFKATGKTLTLNTHSAIFGKWPVTQLMDGPLTLFSPKASSNTALLLLLFGQFNFCLSSRPWKCIQIPWDIHLWKMCTYHFFSRLLVEGLAISFQRRGRGNVETSCPITFTCVTGI